MENRENSKKKSLSGKTREFGNFVKTQGKHREFCLNTGKTQGILLAHFFPEAGLCKLAQGKFAVRQGKHREFENTI